MNVDVSASFLLLPWTFRTVSLDLAIEKVGFFGEKMVIGGLLGFVKRRWNSVKM